MPNIHTASPSLAGAPLTGAGAGTPEPPWHQHPEPVRGKILQYLDVRDLDNMMREAHDAWSEALTDKAFDRAARLAIERHEGTALGHGDPLVDCTFTGQADALAAKGFAYAALLVNLCASRAQLSCVSSDAAAYMQFPETSLGHHLVRHGLQPPGGHPLFLQLLAKPYTPLTRDGVVMNYMTDAVQSTVVDSPLSNRNGASVVLMDQTGVMSHNSGVAA